MCPVPTPSNRLHLIPQYMDMFLEAPRNGDKSSMTTVLEKFPIPSNSSDIFFFIFNERDFLTRFKMGIAIHQSKAHSKGYCRPS